ncbi:MAG: hypothetical protein U0165_17065 [Polyangiaceae bacterium]
MPLRLITWVIITAIEPANLYVTTGGDGLPCIKVLDFGIAKAASLSGFNITRTLSMIGTPLYMSPEQMRNSRGDRCEGRCLVAGVILYQMLTGEVPFRKTSTVDLVMAVDE